MERLWAPWRLEYVRKPDKGGCFLCRILASADEREELLLKRGKSCAVVMNRYPYNNGHLMALPIRHIADAGELTPEERLEMMDLTVDAIAALRKAVCPDGFNVGFNIGKVAGAGLETHLHTHIVPRWNGDTNFMPVLGDTKVIPQSLLELWDELKPLLG
ncbi:MAG: HIT domain-containing protein [Kiritimatiellae bacterium]|nr:HIT domain-containing protein [Kiritimatiellia bacterium]